MLQDRHIDAACALLQTQFLDVQGLQTPLLGNQTNPPFVQIMHAGDIHWNTVVAVIDHTVKVYDSLYHHSFDTCTSMQSAAILRSPHNQITILIENTQEQEGDIDCGLLPSLCSAMETVLNAIGM